MLNDILVGAAGGIISGVVVAYITFGSKISKIDANVDILLDRVPDGKVREIEKEIIRLSRDFKAFHEFAWGSKYKADGAIPKIKKNLKKISNLPNKLHEMQNRLNNVLSKINDIQSLSLTRGAQLDIIHDTLKLQHDKIMRLKSEAAKIEQKIASSTDDWSDF